MSCWCVRQSWRRSPNVRVRNSQRCSLFVPPYILQQIVIKLYKYEFSIKSYFSFTPLKSYVRCNPVHLAVPSFLGDNFRITQSAKKFFFCCCLHLSEAKDESSENRTHYIWSENSAAIDSAIDCECLQEVVSAQSGHSHICSDAFSSNQWKVCVLTISIKALIVRSSLLPRLWAYSSLI